MGALIADTFARYGADPIRFFVVSIGPAVFGSAIASLGATRATPINPSAIGLSFLLSLLSLAVTLVGTGTLYALADGGRAMSLLAAFERGVARSGWLFVAFLALGFGGFLFVLAIAIPAILLIATRTLAVLAIVVVITGFLIFGWAILRLTLVIPAVIVDNLSATQALRRSWKITPRPGVWLRLLGSLFVIGLLVSPASILALLLTFSDLPRPALLILTSLAIAFVTPISALLLYSAYRRLVPPPPLPPGTAATPPVAAPSVAAPPAAPPQPVGASLPVTDPTEPVVPSVAWAAPGSATPQVTPPAGPSGAPAAAGPPFVAPRLGTAGRVILVLAIALGIAGVAGGPYVMGQLVAGRLSVPGGAGFPGFPNIPGFPGSPAAGAVARGTVAFGTSSSLLTCTVQGQTTFLPAGGQGVWIAAFSRRTTLNDEVRLRIAVNGKETANDVQRRGSFNCLGTEELETGLSPGTYVFEVLVNGRVDALGTLVVA